MISGPPYRYARFSTHTNSHKTIVGTMIASAPSIAAAASMACASSSQVRSDEDVRIDSDPHQPSAASIASCIPSSETGR